ncbi:MAG: Phosphoserine phosphatase, partial [Pseudomonadota bacterium]
VLTGHLLDQDWGDICDGEEKKRMLQSTSAKLGINASQCIAVGDGSNDLPMMQWCGLSVAYQAKTKVRQQANIAIDSGGLDRMLEVIQP